MRRSEGCYQFYNGSDLDLDCLDFSISLIKEIKGETSVEHYLTSGDLRDLTLPQSIRNPRVILSSGIACITSKGKVLCVSDGDGDGLIPFFSM